MEVIKVMRRASWFIVKSLLTTAVVVGLFLIYAAEIEPNWVQVKEQPVNITGLPPAFEGFRIVQLSDLHGKVFPDKKIVSWVNRLKPDLIAITGDVFDDDKEPPPEYADTVLGGLTAKQGVYFVFGNNDLYLGSLQVRETLSSLNIKTLANEKVQIMLKGQSLYLFGADYNSPRIPKGAGLNSGPKILLVHKPYIIKDAAEAGMDLILAGHTHGGQIRIPFVRNLVVFVKKGYEHYVSGLYKIGNSQMYITRGLGEAKMPLRFLARPEITVITLHRK